MSLRALLVLGHAAAMGVTTLVSTPHVTRTPPTMLMVQRMGIERYTLARGRYIYTHFSSL